jgi:DNA-binding FadR family transcriptional regulator
MITDAIRGGLYREGDRLPRLADLAARLGVSRHVVREAVDVLRREGVVTVRRGNGGGIVVFSTDNLPRVLANIRGETHSNLRGLLEARRALELAGGAMLTDKITVAELDHLGGLVQELETLVDQPDAFLLMDARFHFAFMSMTRNPLLTDWHQSVLHQIFSASSMFPVGRIGVETAILHQNRTLAAFQRRGRAAVVRALDVHLGELEKVFLGEKLPSW